MFIQQVEGDVETPGCTWGFHWMPGLVLGFEGGLTNPNWDLMRIKLRFWLGNVLRTTTACTFSTSQLPKAFRDWRVLYILTSKCASRYNSVHFLNIVTSKSVPDIVFFVHFDFQMCFAPQRRALFRHLNFQKWSERGVFCTFWLGNVLRRAIFHLSSGQMAPHPPL